jgi:hypothetical protein
MDCASGCLCDDCCAAARSFGFAFWGLGREVATPFGLEDALVSRDGHWHDVADDEYEPLDVYDADGYLYAERRAA